MLEIGFISEQNRKDDTYAILKLAKQSLELTPEFEDLSRSLEASGLKPLDALHLAFASAAKVDYFCTCDDKILKKAKCIEGLYTKVISPTELVMELDI
ncbi:MAG: PIN domain-containing protein [Proteobacteria bacterium]|nr:PIN domain-containing protein [Pseudomonadota bacterium]